MLRQHITEIFNTYLISDFSTLLKSPAAIQKAADVICSGRPGRCPQLADRAECPEIQTTCEMDVDCPAGEKCCMDDCKMSCAPKKMSGKSCLNCFSFEKSILLLSLIKGLHLPPVDVLGPGTLENLIRPQRSHSHSSSLYLKYLIRSRPLVNFSVDYYRNCSKIQRSF